MLKRRLTFWDSRSLLLALFCYAQIQFSGDSFTLLNACSFFTINSYNQFLAINFWHYARLLHFILK